MALIACPECGKQVSDKAAACPNCGRVIKKQEPGSQEGCFLQTLNAGCLLVCIVVIIFVIGMFSATSRSAELRSSSTRAAFVKANPCPTTGASRGACPGWQVDHIVPLKCGGADHADNMQWLTVEAHKAKTGAEAKSCTKPRR